MPKRSRSGLVSMPARVVAPTSVNGGRSSFTLRAAGPFADHDVDLEVLERRIEDLLDDRRQPMDLVDEQHVARLEVGEQRREVAGALEHRARRLAQVDAELVRDDVRQRRLAEARRAEQQHVVERFAALPRRLDEDRELARGSSPARRTRRAARGRSARSTTSSCTPATLAVDDAVELVVLDRHRRDL